MKNSKGLKALGLSILAVLGMMAFSAVGASAQTHEEKLHQEALEQKLLPLSGTSTAGLFLLLHPGKSFEEEKVGSVSVTGAQVGTGRLVVPGRGITIGCASAHIEKGTLSLNEGSATFLFLECTVWVLVKGVGSHNYSLGPASPCHITNLEITATGTVKAILHEGETFILALGHPFTEFTFLSGTGCPLPLTTKVSGSVGALINQLNTNPQLVTLSPQIQLLLGDKLLYGTFESYIEAHGTAKLTGPAGFVEAPFGAH